MGPDYPANWKPLSNDAADSAWRGSPMSMFAKGGRAGCMPFEIKAPREHVEKMAKGGLAGQAKNVAAAGVGGDTMVIHINKDEYKKLCQEWGEPTINPHTGLPQWTPFWKQSWFAPVASLASMVVAPALAPTVGSALGIAEGATFLGAPAANVATGALLGAGTGALTGGGKGALIGGLAGGAGPVLSSALSKGVGSLFGSGTTDAATGTSTLPSWTGSSSSDMSALNAGADKIMATPGNQVLGDKLVDKGIDPSTINVKDGPMSGIMSTLTKPSVLIPAGILGAMALGGGGGGSQPVPAVNTSSPIDPNMTRRLDTTPLNRERLAIDPSMNYYTYGMGRQAKEQQYYAPPEPVQAAHGGPLSHYVQGGGTGRSDSIPAQLSDGEYVMDAETVALLGDGSSKAGAAKLDQFRANIRKQKGRALAKGKFSPDARPPEQYLMGGRA